MEVAESGELCTSAGGWCLPQHCASQWSINLNHQLGSFTIICFSVHLLSLFLSLPFYSFSLFLWCTGRLRFSFVLHGSRGLKGIWGMSARPPLCLLSGFFLITPRPLLPAVLLGKYSTLETDQLHHRCHREHLVITSCAQPPAEFTELSASPVTRLCLYVSLLETLDMLNTPIRPRSSFYRQHLPQKVIFAQNAHLHQHVYTHAPTNKQPNFNLNVVVNAAHLHSLHWLVPEWVYLCYAVSEGVCHRQHGCFQKHWALSVWITAVYICIMPVIMG